MSDIKYGKRVSTVDRTIYIVQTNFPRAEASASGNSAWAAYGWTAYTHRDAPGPCAWRTTHALMKRPEFVHLLTCPERANYETLGIHSYNDVLAYLTPGRALEAAAAIREHGVLSSPYEHDTEWARANRGLSISARVIEHRLASIDRIVEAA